MTTLKLGTIRAGISLGLGPCMAVSVLMLSGCSSFGSSGPRSGSIVAAQGRPLQNQSIRIVEVNDTTSAELSASDKRTSFDREFKTTSPEQQRLGRGDLVDVTVYEATPAVLFGNGPLIGRAESGGSGSANFPQLEVDTSGQLTIPFAGTLKVGGLTTAQLQQLIASRLAGIANKPQVLARITRNQSSTVTLVGEFTSTTRVPLSPRGEKLLDVIAAVGGVRQPIGKTVIQLTREGHSASMPLSAIINDPAENISMRPNDVVSALFQPFSFTALGAVGENKEISFEATGLSLSQALGRMGGLRDDRANPNGVFVFRFEDGATSARVTGDTGLVASKNGVPLIYHFDLKKPETLFYVQSFKINNGDIVYVANSSITDLQKVLNMFSAVIFSAAGVNNLTK